MTRIEIDPDRMLADLDELRGIGAVASGVVRPAYSATDLAARIWLTRRMQAAGLTVSVDAMGNVFGVPPGDGPCILVGSHTDTQPEGGWLDGAYGVIAGLEIARASIEQGGPRIACVSFQDEEGRFCALTGSRVWTGALSLEAADRCRDASGLSLGEARQERSGLPLPAQVPTGLFRAFLEIHIEQGGVLHASGERIGVVDAIVGIATQRMQFLGQQNHAGTTPMHLRRDAFQGLVAFSAALEAELAAVMTPASVWTIGQVELRPNATSIVPGQVDFTLQWRDADEARLERMGEIIHATAARIAESRGLEWRHGGTDRIAPTRCDAALVAALGRAAERLAPGRWRSMASGALHDAANLALKMPVAMLFVPSIDGISHDFAEDTDRDDLALGAAVLADAIAAYAGG